MDSISEERLNQVHPVLAAKVRGVAATLLAKNNIVIRVAQGLRTVEEQDALFHQVPKVTNAPGGYSWHNFGLAVDCYPGLHGVTPWKPNFQAEHPDFKLMIAAGVAAGLVSGSTWVHMPDKPHFQLAGIPVSPTDLFRETLAHKGLAAMWAQLVPAEPKP